MNDSRATMPHHSVDPEALLSRYALRVAARLSQQSNLASHDVSERLRFARERAVEHARIQRAAVAVPSAVLHAGAAVLGVAGGPRSATPWWIRWASVLPLVALVAGLVLIQNQYVRAQISAAAEIDSALLSDELPPTAYSDPGFVEFLKAPHE